MVNIDFNAQQYGVISSEWHLNWLKLFTQSRHMGCLYDNHVSFHVPLGSSSTSITIWEEGCYAPENH